MEQYSSSSERFRMPLIIFLIYLAASKSLQWFSILQYRLSTVPKGFYDSQFELVAQAFRYVQSDIFIN